MKTEHEAFYSANVAVPGGGTDIYFDGVGEARAFDRDPDGVTAAYFGLTLEEYHEWVALNGRPLCGCMTKAGKLCRQSVGRIQQDADQWKQHHRRIACTIHEAVLAGK